MSDEQPGRLEAMARALVTGIARATQAASVIEGLTFTFPCIHVLRWEHPRRGERGFLVCRMPWVDQASWHLEATMEAMALSVIQPVLRDAAPFPAYAPSPRDKGDSVGCWMCDADLNGAGTRGVIVANSREEAVRLLKGRAP